MTENLLIREEGCTADLVLVEAEAVAHAVASRPIRKLVVKRGRVVARDGRPLVEGPCRQTLRP